MSNINVNLLTDGDGLLINPASWPHIPCERTITFAGATENAWGDDGGTLDGGSMFTVTGIVRVRLIANCTVDLVGAVSLEAGVVGGTAILIAQIADAEGIDVGEFWFGAGAPTTSIVPTSAPEKVIASDIILTYGGNITAGAIKFSCSWTPVTANGLVVPTAN